MRKWGETNGIQNIGGEWILGVFLACLFSSPQITKTPPMFCYNYNFYPLFWQKRKKGVNCGFCYKK